MHPFVPLDHSRIYICICASICSFIPSENLHLYLCVHLFLWDNLRIYILILFACSLPEPFFITVHTFVLDRFLVYIFVTLFYFCAQYLPDSFRAWKPNGRGKKLRSSLIPELNITPSVRPNLGIFKNF